MGTGLESDGPASLLGITIRRSVVLGRLYLVIGIGYLVILSITTSFTARGAFEGLLPLFLPIFAVVGSMGGLMAFTNDRMKGVFEYLIAYGVSPRRLFVNVLAASVVLVTILVGISLAVDLGVYLGKGNTISAVFVQSLAFYSVPMSYASAAFAATVGMFWTSLSSPRMGLNSPIGLMPLIGIVPSILTLAVVVAAGISSSTSIYLVLGVSVSLVVLLVVVLLSLVGRLLRRERLLSPA
jgi:hypothetical protein